ncbi:hypothetical protein [Ammoniphilus sp. CFH 90114]|uniref:hypothetical protein n=1 Tax=Ammoniphilus sp. CFH 90114 TaxID=2493665 RepID=UPI00100DB10B|nr:hypothetical protein [Ammoniphilus sp. CFH 90114]RXT07772.1 hypothetical protein EIZ39_10080 [Ammoniphilus sp. CFH 90114]
MGATKKRQELVKLIQHLSDRDISLVHSLLSRLSKEQEEKPPLPIEDPDEDLVVEADNSPLTEEERKLLDRIDQEIANGVEKTSCITVLDLGPRGDVYK